MQKSEAAGVFIHEDEDSPHHGTSRLKSKYSQMMIRSRNWEKSRKRRRSWKDAKATADQSGLGVQPHDDTASIDEVLGRGCSFYLFRGNMGETGRAGKFVHL